MTPPQTQQPVPDPLVRLANFVVASFESIVMIAIIVTPILFGLMAFWWGGLSAFLVFAVIGWFIGTAFLGGFVVLARILRVLERIEAQSGQGAPTLR